MFPGEIEGWAVPRTAQPRAGGVATLQWDPGLTLNWTPAFAGEHEHQSAATGFPFTCTPSSRSPSTFLTMLGLVTPLNRLSRIVSRSTGALAKPWASRTIAQFATLSRSIVTSRRIGLNGPFGPSS